MYFILAFLVLVFPLAASADSIDSTVASKFTIQLNKTLADFSNHQKTLASRALAQAALTALVLNGDVQTAQMLLSEMFNKQNMDEDARSFGDIPWNYRGDKIRDANSIEFCMIKILPIFLDSSWSLSTDFVSDSMPHLKAALNAIRHHKVNVAYTNIFLMKTVNLILLGQVLQDPVTIEEGKKQMQDWLSFTFKYGISEYDSPTYSSVDTDDLVLGYIYATDPELKNEFKEALDYLWKDLSSNYFSAGEMLSGPNSRQYNFLGPQGSIDLWNYTFGLRPDCPKDNISVENVTALLNLRRNGYTPSEDILNWAFLDEKIVLQTWGLQPGETRYNYITHHFAVGSVSFDDGPQDKNIVVEFDRPKLTNMAVIVDDMDNPYGVLKKKDKSGHPKPVHLRMHPLCVQDKGKILALLQIRPDTSRDYTSLATNIILPSQADSILINGQAVDINNLDEMPLSLGDVISVKVGDTLASVKIFAAEGVGDNMPKIVLKADSLSDAKHVLRVAIYHYQDVPMHSYDDHAFKVGLLFDVRSLVLAQDLFTAISQLSKATIEQNNANGAWDVKAAWDGIQFEASKELDNDAILIQNVNGQPMEFDRLSVNKTVF